MKIRHFLLAAALLLSSLAQAHGIVPLIYHRVLPTAAAPNGTSVTQARFKEHIMALEAAGVVFLSASEATAILMGGRPSPSHPAVVLTFDDGFDISSTLQWLNDRGVRSTLFITTGALDTPGYFRTTALKGLSQSPLIEFGAHSVTHFPSWSGVPGSIPEDDQLKELGVSMRDLREIVGSRVYHYAWPYGETSRRLIETAPFYGAVSSWGADANTDNNVPGADVRYIQRLNVSGRCSAAQVLNMVKTGRYDSCEK